MNFNSNVSDEEVYSSVSLDLSALEKLDEITQRLTMDALNASDTAASHPKASTSGEHSEQVSTRKKRNSLDSSIVLNDEEMKYRLKLYPEPSKVLKDKIRCTACGTSLLKHVMKGLGLYFHPLLQVLLCQECREFYGDGDFPVDDDNSDTYCRWCAQGGCLFCCSVCSFVFCKPCIRRNFKHSMLDEIEEEDWKCFFCNPEALWKHRAICWAAREYVENHPRVDKNMDTSDEEPQRRRKPRERKENRKEKDVMPKKIKSHVKALRKDSEDETQDDDVNRKKKSRKKKDTQSDEKVNHTPVKENHKKEKKKEKKKEEENVCPELEESFIKSGEEDVVRDAKETGNGKHLVEDSEDENARQILVMRKTSMLMEKLTKDTQNVTQSATKKAIQLHAWISGKNKNSHKQLPTTPVKLGKMIASFKKILLGLRVHTEELQNKVVEAEEEWTKNWEGGEKSKENEENIGQEEDRVNGEVAVKGGEEERPMQKEQIDEENGMQGEEEGDNERHRINGVDDVSKSDFKDMNGLNVTSGIEDVESEELEEHLNAEKNKGSEECDDNLSDAETLVMSVIEKDLESGKETESNVDSGRNKTEAEADQKSHIDGSNDKLDDKAKDKGEVLENEKVVERKVVEEEEKVNSGDEGAEDGSANAEGDGDKADEPMDVAETEDAVAQNSLSNKDSSSNLAGNSKADFSFDIFEDDDQSPTNIPIPPSDSEEENVDASMENDSVKDGKVECPGSKDLVLSNGDKTVKDSDKKNKNTENSEVDKKDNSEDEKEVERDEAQAAVHVENSSRITETEDKTDTENVADDRDNTESSIASKDGVKKVDKLVIKVKKEDCKESDKTEETSEKIKSTKVDRDAKLELLLDSAPTSESDDEAEKRKKRYTKKKNKHLKDSSDSDSSSSDEHKAVIRKKTRSESSDEEVPVEELISQFDDEKLKAGCLVLLNKLNTDDHENIPDTSEPKKTKTVCKEDSIEKAIKRLGNFRTLDRTRSNHNTSPDDSDAENKKKPKDKRKPSDKSKKEKKISEDDHNNSSDEAPRISLEEIESMEKLNVFPEKVDSEMDALAKKMLCESSASDLNFSDEEKKEDPKKKKNVEKPPKEKSVEKDDKGNSSDDFEVKRSNKSRHKDKLLSEKLSETDSSNEEKKWKEKKSQSDTDEEPESKVKIRKLRRRRLASSSSDEIKISSDSSSSDSSISEVKKRKRAPKSDSSENKSSDSKTKKKQKRRRIKTVNTDSDSDGGDDDEDKDDDTPNKGRKNIRKVLKGDRLGEETKQAAKMEEERKKRISDRQKLYNDIFTDSRNLKVLEKLVLDFDPETKKELVYVDPGLVKKLKPHQAEGVKFMWDACFESLKRMETEKGSGCILAHCMGLGKTLQVIALVHTLLFNPKTKVHTVLVICPLNTVLNWVNEFKIWLKDLGSGKDVEVYEISKYKANVERMYQLKDWQSDGGVMVIGYDMYRNLASTGGKKRKKIIEVFQSTLVDPGPDLVICDEGHLLKNISSALSKAVNAIKTARRIVLTGTPLQNNLKEYHCMIQFVKPSLLGTHKEFLNRFVNPISNGQCADSTPHDVRVMKRRAHVLHKMLEGCVQRRDYSVLTPFLPPKHEFVICIRLTELQSKLYIHYLENFAQKSTGGGASLFNDFQNLQRIWTHPRVLKMSTEREEKKKLMQSDSEGSLKDFIDDDSTESETTESSESSGNKKKKRKKIKRSCKKNNSSSSESSDIICLSDENKEKKSKDTDGKEDEIVQTEQKAWWEAFVEPDDHDKIIHSGKLTLLLDILQKCELIGDKVLLFSQSLYSLNLIEYFLEQIDEKTQSLTPEKSTEETENEKVEFNFVGSWIKGLDYFRIDGSVSGENRNIWCKSFNKEDNVRARLFLISTRAGGMGINLVGANRVILFDASWNPSSDLQSIFRIYRFGQKKPCYVYRFLAQGTMEEKIYNRQVTKLSLASRVLDEHQIERHFNFEDLQELYRYEPTITSMKSTPMLPKDRLLAELIQKYSDLIDNFHEHDSLLENKAEEELTEEERKAAWEDFENEKKEKLPENLLMGMDGGVIGGMQNQMFADQIAETIPGLMEAILQKHPNATEEQLSYELRLATSRLSQYFNRAGLHQQQQMFNHMAAQNQMQGNASLYPRVRQPIPQQAALMQAHYGLQNYYHNPLYPSSSTNSRMMLPTQVQNNAGHYIPGVMNSIQQQLLLQQQNAHSNMLPTIQNPVEGSAVQPVKLKIRQDLMPSASDDNDIIIESVKRRE